MTLEIIPIKIEKEIEPADDIVRLMMLSAHDIQVGDIVVFTQKIISKQEGQIVNLSSIKPSLLATGIASEYGKDRVRHAHPNLVPADRRAGRPGLPGGDRRVHGR